MSGTALISASTRLPEVETKVAVASVAGAVPSTFREEQLAGAATVLGCHDGGEVTTANVAHKPLGRCIEPPDDPRIVEDVARDADALQSMFDVAADFQAASCHLGSVADLVPR